MNKKTITLALAGLFSAASANASDNTKLLLSPTISKNHIAFVYAGDIYRTNKKGEEVVRLTSHAADERDPHLSPNGKLVAYTGGYDGNSDVYIISIDGGQPKRLTFHSSRDTVIGWADDGDSVLFTSYRETANGRTGQLYKVSVKGGLPEKVMEASVANGDLSNDNRYLAYNPHNPAHGGSSGWRNHRGGTTPPVWIYDLKENSYQEIPHVNASDTHPMWVGDKVYFLSDRSKHKRLYSYDDGKIKQVSKNKNWDITSADAYGREIVYSMGGELYIFDSKKKRSKKLDISLNPDLPQLRASWKSAMPSLTNAALSTTGKRVLLSARGEIFSVPIKDGATKNLTKSSGANDRDGLWSPKGDELAYITDENGLYQIVITDQFGKEKKRFAANESVADARLLHFTGDGKQLVYTDSKMNLWLLELDSGNKTKVMQNINMNGFNTAVSKDGKLLAYTKTNENYFRDLYVYEIASGEHVKITDSMSHSTSPAFSPDGELLYFASSTNHGQNAFFLDMSTQENPQRYGLYAVVLKAEGKSPLLPKLADEDAVEEKSADDKSAAKDDSKEEKSDKKLDKKEVKAAIDAQGIETRIVALPVPQRFYSSLTVGDDKNLYFVENKQPGSSIETSGRALRDASLKRFNTKKRKVEEVKSGVFSVRTSHDGKHLLMLSQGNKLSVGKVAATVKAKAINTAGVKALIEPRQEWAQIFTEGWRNQRDYFYDANFHGLDWQKVYEKYQPLVEHVGRREDLNYLMREMISEMEVGHNVVYGGDGYREQRVSVGLLGADFVVKNNQYTVGKIYTGENWNPHLKAPLAMPGIEVAEGDVIHSVDGEPLTGEDNIYRLFTGKANTQVRLEVSKTGKQEDAKVVVVETISNERMLRHWNWVEDNRKYVWQQTDGKSGYVYLPNTTTAGYTNFNRMFYPQTDKPSMIIDERSNGGGQAANYITDVLSRQYLAGWKYRSGDMILSTPAGAVYGPKVMLIDQDAGSGGDFLPYSFSRMGLGTLIGKTTWGGLIGVSANRNFIDGGRMNVPHFRFFTPDHEWRVENEGVKPDIDVEQDPVLVNQGKDPQLDRAISEVLEQLKTYKPVRHTVAPAMPKELGK